MSVDTAPNAHRLLWAGFFSIFAAGVGFSVRAGILPDWASQYGFTNTELGAITGGGLTGFGIIIIAGSLIADRVGYGLLMSLAFLLHIVSAVMVLGTDFVYQHYGQNAVYWSLFVSMFLFSIANGLCEVVVNPMTATLFPYEKTHYLNVLHAGWPGGLIAGGLVAWLMNNGKIGDWEPIGKVHWMIQMSLFLVPVLVYGLLLLGQRLPRSEAAERGVDLKTMLLEFASPLLLLLLFIHALVGYVELGTDSWIAKITGTIMGEGTAGRLLFVYTSGLMFTLRFFAGPLEKLFQPLGLLCICAVMAAAGLVLLGTIEGVFMCVVAATVYGFGKTFFWPTMLAVVSERFPKGGALTLGAIGGMGMLSAGLLGGPGIGFKQDYYASNQLRTDNESTYKRYAKETPNIFLGLEVYGLDGTRVGVLELAEKQRKETDPKKQKDLERELQLTLERAKAEEKLKEWWEGSKTYAQGDYGPIERSTLYGGRMALLMTASVPALMALLYLGLILYFRSIGGYKPLSLHH